MKAVTFPITLVSPHPRGPKVREAQEALTNNAYRDFLEGGEIDGEFGPWTARATARAKFELGWVNVTQQYGQGLHDVLTGATKLGPAKRLLRRKRLRALARWSRGERTVREAARDVGLTEDPPGSNRNRISVAYGIIAAWCMMATSTWAKRAGSKIPVIGKGVAGSFHYCPTVMNLATAGQGGLTLVKRPRIGDWPLFDWGGDKISDHVEVYVCNPSRPGELEEALQALADMPGVRNLVAELARRARELGPAAFITIGGNTSFEGQSGSQSDGGAVAVRIRFESNVARNLRGDMGWVRLER